MKSFHFMLRITTAVFILLCVVPTIDTVQTGVQVLRLRQENDEPTSGSSGDHGFWVAGYKNDPKSLACPPSHFIQNNKCKPCDVCAEKEYEITTCTVKRNAICLSHRELKIGLNCLHWRRIRHFKHLINLKQSIQKRKQRFPCSSKYGRLVKKLYRKLSVRGKVKGPSEFETRALKTQHDERRGIVKRETAITESVVSIHTSSTTPAADLMSFDIYHNKYPIRRKWPKKANKKPPDPPTDESQDHHSDHPIPTIMGILGPVKPAATSPTQSKTAAPKEKGGAFDISKNREADTPIQIGNGADDSQSTDLSWLYGLIGVAVLIFAVSFFIVSRARQRQTLQKSKNIKRCLQEDPVTADKKSDIDKPCYTDVCFSHDTTDLSDSSFNRIVTFEKVSDSVKIHNFPKQTNVSTEKKRNEELDSAYDRCSSPPHRYASPPRELSRTFDEVEQTTNRNHSSLRQSQSLNFDCRSKTQFDKSSEKKNASSSQYNLDWLEKMSNIKTKNDFGSYHSEAETQTDNIDTVSHNATTVFNTPWQFSGTFSRDGGILQRKHSDVMLVVGRDAVQTGDFVKICGAIFLDSTEIRRKFDLSSNEMLITPLIEYHAEGAYQFQQHVSVKLPHALPDDYDVSLVQFYTFSVDDCGNVLQKLLPMKSKENDAKEDAYWEVSSQDRCFVAKTTHFSGYFCTTCESKAKLPSIYARVFGSHIQIKSNRREVRLILYLWDRRLNIKDFIEAIKQQECDMDRQLLADEPVPLLDNASSDSSIIMRMETLGDLEDQKLWRHITRSSSSRPLFKPLQVRKLRQIVLCCQQSDPMRVEWAMENVPNAIPSSVFQCLIEMVHVPEGETNYEEAFQDADEEYIRTFYVRNLKLTMDSLQDIMDSNADLHSRQELLKKTMKHVMDRRDIENICLAFGIDKREIGNFSQKVCSEDALKTELLEECSRKCGAENFIQALPHVLKQIQSFHIIQALQERGLLSTFSSCKSAGDSITPSREWQGPKGTEIRENTACKSFVTCTESECRQGQCANSGDILNGYLSSKYSINNHLTLSIGSNSVIASDNETSPDSACYGSPPNAAADLSCDNNISNGNAGMSSYFSQGKQNGLSANSINFPSSITDNNAYSTSNCLESSSNYDEVSCLATIDSQDLQKRENIDSCDNYEENTLKKELAVSRSAYPEIPEEKKLPQNKPYTTLNADQPKKVDLNSLYQKLDMDETFVKGD